MPPLFIEIVVIRNCVEVKIYKIWVIWHCGWNEIWSATFGNVNVLKWSHNKSVSKFYNSLNELDELQMFVVLKKHTF